MGSVPVPWDRLQSSRERWGPVGCAVPRGPSCVSDGGFTRWAEGGLLERRRSVPMVQPCPCPGGGCVGETEAGGKQSCPIPFLWLCCVLRLPPAPGGWGFGAPSPPHPPAAVLLAKFVLERDPFFFFPPSFPSAGAHVWSFNCSSSHAPQRGQARAGCRAAAEGAAGLAPLPPRRGNAPIWQNTAEKGLRPSGDQRGAGVGGTPRFGGVRACGEGHPTIDPPPPPLPFAGDRLRQTENRATRCKVERLQLLMQQKRLRRKARRDARGPYHWLPNRKSTRTNSNSSVSSEGSLDLDFEDSVWKPEVKADMKSEFVVA